ncbi:MAG: class I SAM-dependent methyltransferase [Clostridia bacterium]|nr:class I SAM-dependent methyltransferase [Clostridia bacterium]
MENTTAKVSCFARAYHYKNNQAHIFADSAAEAILGDDYQRIAESMGQGIHFFFPGFQGTKEEGLRMIVDQQLSPSVLGRSAYSEKMLENEMRLGCKQYLVFAAGYDTFAIRHCDTTLAVYELDLPEMLDDKRKRIMNAGLISCAVDVPCSLASAEWADELLKKGYRKQEKTFGSLLGISYYLSKSEFRDLISAVGRIFAQGSAICFDVPSENESRETKINQALARGAGEQMKALYSYRELESLLDECGFRIYEHLDHQAMTEQYFSDYNSHTPDHPIAAPEGVSYILAVRA